MSVSFGGIGELAATFLTHGTVNAGDAGKMYSDGTVAACEADDEFCGVAINVSDDGHATVQLGGYIVMPYTGTAPSLGYEKLLAASGGVAADEDGREYLVAEVNETAATVGFFM